MRASLDCQGIVRRSPRPASHLHGGTNIKTGKLAEVLAAYAAAGPASTMSIRSDSDPVSVHRFRHGCSRGSMCRGGQRSSLTAPSTDNASGRRIGLDRDAICPVVVCHHLARLDLANGLRVRQLHRLRVGWLSTTDQACGGAIVTRSLYGDGGALVNAPGEDRPCAGGYRSRFPAYADAMLPRKWIRGEGLMINRLTAHEIPDCPSQSVFALVYTPLQVTRLVPDSYAQLPAKGR